jgi:hypothetical protein
MLAALTQESLLLAMYFLLARGAVTWKSLKQSIIANSTIEAEFVTCFEATIQAL